MAYCHIERARYEQSIAKDVEKSTSDCRSASLPNNASCLREREKRRALPMTSSEAAWDHATLPCARLAVCSGAVAAEHRMSSGVTLSLHTLLIHMHLPAQAALAAMHVRACWSEAACSVLNDGVLPLSLWLESAIFHKGHRAGETSLLLLIHHSFEAQWLISAISKSLRKTLLSPELSLSTNRQVVPEGGLYHAIHGTMNSH